MSLFHRFAIPFHCFHRILLHAFTESISYAQKILRISISLCRRLTPPFHGFHIIFLHSIAKSISSTKKKLRLGQSLFRRLAIPSNRFRMVLLHAFAPIITSAEPTLRPCDSVILRQRFQALKNDRLALFRQRPQFCFLQIDRHDRKTAVRKVPAQLRASQLRKIKNFPVQLHKDKQSLRVDFFGEAAGKSATLVRDRENRLLIQGVDRPQRFPNGDRMVPVFQQDLPFHIPEGNRRSPDTQNLPDHIPDFPCLNQELPLMHPDIRGSPAHESHQFQCAGIVEFPAKCHGSETFAWQYHDFRNIYRQSIQQKPRIRINRNKRLCRKSHIRIEIVVERHGKPQVTAGNLRAFESFGQLLESRAKHPLFALRPRILLFR